MQESEIIYHSQATRWHMRLNCNVLYEQNLISAKVSVQLVKLVAVVLPTDRYIYIYMEHMQVLVVRYSKQFSNVLYVVSC